MKVRHGRAEHAFDSEITVRRLLETLDVVPEGVVVAVNGELVTTDTTVRPGDDVEIIRAISGGAAARRWQPRKGKPGGRKPGGRR